MTTQAEFIRKTRVRLDESTARQWDDRDIREWINEGSRDIARRTEALEDRESITIVVGTAEYSLPDSTIRVHRVECTPTGADTTNMEYVDIKDMDSFGWRQRTMRQDRPYVYSIWGSGRALKLITFPVPAIAGSLTVWFYRLPTSLSETTLDDAGEEVEVPPAWDDILLDYIEYRAMRKDRDPRWQEAKAIYDENSASMYDNTRRWVDQGGMVLPNSSHLPIWLTEG